MISGEEITTKMKPNLLIVFIFLNLIVLVCCAVRPTSRPAQQRGPVQPDPIIRSETVSDTSDPATARNMNPVSRLNLMQSKRKSPGPSYDLIEIVNIRNAGGSIINTRFHIEAKLNEYTKDGWGYSKKEAKREAAKALLQAMNFQV